MLRLGRDGSGPGPTVSSSTAAWCRAPGEGDAMLHCVDVGVQNIDSYEASAGAEPVAQLRALAAPLRGARVLHLNATPYGGGVAEILRSEVPLLRDLGVEADWKIITGDATFFNVTKVIHNGLQGATRDLSAH